MAVRLAVHTQATRPLAREPLVYEFDQARVSIGRASSSDVQLPDPTVSSSHASIRVHQTGYAAFDEGSTNGTFVNGTRIAAGRPKPLRSGDVVQVGAFAIAVEVAVAVPASTSAEQTAAMARRLAREILEGRGEAPGAPTLTVLNGPAEGRVVTVPEPPGALRIGRDEGCDLALSDADLSREHALVRRGDDGTWIEDLGSKNGVSVNGRAVDRRRLRDRDEIELGKTTLFFADPEAVALRALEKEPDAKPAGPPPSIGAPPEDAAAVEASVAEESTDPPPDAAIDGRADDAPSVKPPPAPPARPPLAPGEGRIADMMIYMLAGAVLALSAVGLYLLLRAG